jgi:alginate O-acetyltransferase complex protein AlgI
MLFNSLEFLKFFTLVFAAYWLLPAAGGGRWWRRAAAVGFVLALAYGYVTVDRWWLILCGDRSLPRPPVPATELVASVGTFVGEVRDLGAIAPRIDWNEFASAWTASSWGSTPAPWRDWVGLFAALAAVGGLSASTAERAQRGRVWLLLGASFCFYAAWNSQLALLIAVTTYVDFLVARGMDTGRREWWRRTLLVGSLVMNLGLLCYFKYMNFFLQSLNDALRAAGGSGSIPLLSVVLPIGISFYTFEAINYTVDVYRRRIPAERGLANFMTFILFFPHLVAGPIVRARDFLPQLTRSKRFDWMRMELGVRYFLMGLFKKLAIADRMALYVDPVFADPAHFNTEACWVAVLAYALQIYCDFSGYTDMALGAAHMLGYKLALNFNMPYLAANVSDFWRRWHISLSGWFRDYVYIPLGGSRSGPWVTDRNIMITFTLSGLWHGASWTFVIWGVLHGLMLVGHRRFREWATARPTLDGVLQSLPGTLVRVTLTFLVVVLAWVFFRAQTFEAAFTILKQLFVAHAGTVAPLSPRGVYYTLLVVAICHLIGASGGWRWAAPRLPAPALGFGYAAMLTLALLLCPDTGKAFIYFQF